MSLDKIFAFTEAYKLHDTYSSSQEAALKCGLDKYYNVYLPAKRGHINNRFIDCVIEG